MKFGLPVSMQATDTGSRLVCMIVKMGFKYLRGLSDFVVQKGLPGACLYLSYAT